MVTILAPVAYLAFLIGSLYTFSKVYRRRKAAAATSAKPWFPPHHERDLYISLLSMEPPPPDSLLKAALLNRAFQDIKRLMRLNQAKAALSTLLQKGQVGDDIWNRFLEAEKEHQAELQEVVQEANTFREGWGQFIFVTANEMVSHTFQKENYASVEKEGNDDAEDVSLLNLPANPSNRLLCQPPKLPDNIKISIPQPPQLVQQAALQQQQQRAHAHPHPHPHPHPHLQGVGSPSPAPARAQALPPTATPPRVPSLVNGAAESLSPFKTPSQAGSVIDDSVSEAGTSDVGDTQQGSSSTDKKKKKGKRKK